MAGSRARCRAAGGPRSWSGPPGSGRPVASGRSPGGAPECRAPVPCRCAPGRAPWPDRLVGDSLVVVGRPAVEDPAGRGMPPPPSPRAAATSGRACGCPPGPSDAFRPSRDGHDRATHGAVRAGEGKARAAPVERLVRVFETPHRHRRRPRPYGNGPPGVVRRPRPYGNGPARAPETTTPVTGRTTGGTMSSDGAPDAGRGIRTRPSGAGPRPVEARCGG